MRVLVRIVLALTLIAAFGASVALPQSGPLAPLTEQVNLQPSVAYAATCNGPDGFGYRCVNSTRAYVSGTTDIGNHCDDCLSNVALPFAFTFYGQVYNAATAGSNGTLQFASSSFLAPVTLPSAVFNQAIFAFSRDSCTDLDCFGVTPAAQGIFTTTTGTAPNRTFVIEWRVNRCCFSLPNPSLFFEIQLDEGTNTVHLVYGNSTDANSLGGAGIQQGDGSGGNTFLAYRSNQAIPSNGTAVCFTLSAVCTTAVTATPTGSPLPGSTATATVTATVPAGSTATATATVTPSPAPGATATATSGTVTTTGSVPQSEDNTDKKRHLTDEQKQQRQRTNRYGNDQYRTQGNVVLVERSGDQQLVTIMLGRNESLVVVVSCPNGSCENIRVGDYLEADGEQGDDGRFIAESVEVTHF